MIKTGCGIKKDKPFCERDAIRLGDKFQEMLFDLPFRIYRTKSKNSGLKFHVKVRCLPTNEQKAFLKVGLNERNMVSGFERVEVNGTVYKV